MSGDKKKKRKKSGDIPKGLQQFAVYVFAPGTRGTPCKLRTAERNTPRMRKDVQRSQKEGKQIGRERRTDWP